VDLVGRIFVAFFAPDSVSGGGCNAVDLLLPVLVRVAALTRETIAGLGALNPLLWLKSQVLQCVC
jgi:hypothetical protein